MKASHVTVSRSKRGTTIKASGRAAQALFDVATTGGLPAVVIDADTAKPAPGPALSQDEALLAQLFSAYSSGFYACRKRVLAMCAEALKAVDEQAPTRGMDEWKTGFDTAFRTLQTCVENFKLAADGVAPVMPADLGQGATQGPGSPA